MKRMSRAWCLFAAARATLAATLPYIPTRVLKHPGAPWVYIFEPFNGTEGQFQLLKADYTNFATPSPSLIPVSTSLPYLQNGASIPFIPVIDRSGNITVIVGNSTEANTATEIWRLTPDDNGDEQWKQHSLLGDTSSGFDAADSSYFLANAVTFSSFVESTEDDTNVFVFGGMSPYANSSPTNWQSAASYTNSMRSFLPDGSAKDTGSYNISLATGRGGPIAEAGFTMTSLPPTFSANISGVPQTQQQDIVLLGGHTQNAFINMSQVAIYSLPQQGWTFLPVAQPSGSTQGHAVRDNQPVVEPRSGHTAAISEDGSQIVIYGGWVGDVTTPAQPQLAILSINANSGGQSNWTWSIPQSNDDNIQSSQGIYGHGATMLPGNIMMVYGGSHINATSNQRRNAGARITFYNMSDNSWSDSYEPPASSTPSEDDSGPLHSPSQQAGLGAGLGIGAALLFTLVGFYSWYSRRLKKARERRATVLLTYSSGSSFRGHERSLSDVTPAAAPGFGLGMIWNRWNSEQGVHSQDQDMVQIENHRSLVGATGLSVDVPSPTRGLRKKPTGRPYTYHAAPLNEESRLNRGSGYIHPIAELENEDGVETSDRYDEERIVLNDAERKLREVEAVLRDPFVDPPPNPLGSHPVAFPVYSPPVDGWRHSAPNFSFRIPRKPVPSDVVDPAAHWVVEDETSEAVFAGRSGRASPSKTDERTSSTLSERSIMSHSSITRTMSAKTGAILAAAAARIAHGNSDYSRVENRSPIATSSSSNRSPGYFSPRDRPTTRDGPLMFGGASDSDSFTTTRSNFAQLQLEGQELLGGRPMYDPDDPYQRAMAASTLSPIRASVPRYDIGTINVPNRRRTSLMGSLRRALNAVAIAGDRTFSLTSPSATERYFDEKRASSTSPHKERFADDDRRRPTPRRAVSDGGALLRQKRGEKDWQDGKQWPPYRDDPDGGDWGEPRSSLDRQRAEEEWDVEGAAAQRDIQVMFSVPKANLRVVNADVERASLRSVSDGALSRAGSINKYGTGVHRHESIRSISRADSSGRRALGPTVEEVIGEDDAVGKAKDA